MLSDDKKVELRKRLAKISGQINGIQKMIDEDRYCVDTLIQLASVRAAVGKVSNEILDNHMRTCVQSSFRKDDPAAAQEKIDELMDVFSKYMAR